MEESSNWCFPVLSASHICLLDPDWLIELFALVAIGQSRIPFFSSTIVS